MEKYVNIIGAGLAGCEAAWQLAKKGIKTRLFEMKPSKYSPAHKSEHFAELVCSNSLRSDDVSNAAGLLKEEMRKLDSIVMVSAEKNRVPAGKALAVDRIGFARFITEKIEASPEIEVVRQEITSLEKLTTPLIIASGPLTSPSLAVNISRLIGEDHLYFYDSVAPIIDAGSIDFKKGFEASRHGYGGNDYWNFPLSENQYTEFLMDLLSAEKVLPHGFEKPLYFEGCLPIEVMAERGPQTLRYGPMKPFGLADPKSGQIPYAVVQLRREDRERSMYNMVGFQTKLTWPEQERIFKKFPGFENAVFLRHGVIHRNTYINSPGHLDEKLEFTGNSGIFFAGQITGVEGYLESAATGLWAGHYLSEVMLGRHISPPPHTTAIGSLIWHVANPNHRNFQPMNVHFGLMPIMGEKIAKKERKFAMISRARNDFASWISSFYACVRL